MYSALICAIGFCYYYYKTRTKAAGRGPWAGTVSGLDFAPPCEVIFKSHSHGRAASDLCFSKSKFWDSSTNVISTSYWSNFIIGIINKRRQNHHTSNFSRSVWSRAKIRFKKIIVGRGPCMGDGFSRITISCFKSTKQKPSSKLSLFIKLRLTMFNIVLYFLSIFISF